MSAASPTRSIKPTSRRPSVPIPPAIHSRRATTSRRPPSLDHKHGGEQQANPTRT